MDNNNGRVVLPSNSNSDHTGVNNTEFARFPMDKILDASFGEVSSKITASFKKTVLIRDYETEVIEASTTLDMAEPLVGAARMFITAVLEVQLEYTAYLNLFFKGLVTESALLQRKKELEQEIYTIKYNADKVLGPGATDKYINDINLDKV